MDCLPLISEKRADAFEAHIPGSKSFTNRSLILAAHQMGRTTIHNALICDDTCLLARALDAFGGLHVEQHSDSFVVERTAERLTAPEQPVFMGGAGTPARLVLAFASGVEGETLVTGNARLSERPMQDILKTLGDIGIRYECLKLSGCLPVRIQGGKIQKSDWLVNGSVSSQFLTSLLIHASQQSQFASLDVRVKGHLVSEPYVNMTLSMMNSVGLRAEKVAQGHYRVYPGAVNCRDIQVEVDASGMSYLLAAAVLTQSTVKIPGIDLKSAQGDVGLLRIFEQMGCELREEANAVVLTGKPLSGIEVDMETMPDVVLTLAVVATQAAGPVTITNIANLRIKECDRIAACCAELKRLGVRVDEGEDWLRVYPAASFTPACIHCYDDHRVAMAFSLLGLIAPGISVAEPACVSKSFPGYWAEMQRFVDFHAA